MEIGKEIEEARRKRSTVVERLNQIDEEKATLVQELLRLEGELRLLDRLAKELK